MAHRVLPARIEQTCQPYDAGKYSEAGSSDCALECNAGRVKGDSSMCAKCGAGKFSRWTGAKSESACTPCDAETYSAQEGSSACTLCDLGHYSSKDSLSCFKCEAWAGHICLGGSVSKEGVKCPGLPRRLFWRHACGCHRFGFACSCLFHTLSLHMVQV